MADAESPPAAACPSDNEESSNLQIIENEEEAALISTDQPETSGDEQALPQEVPPREASPEASPQDEPQASEEVDDAEAAEKSRKEKEAFMQMFRVASSIKDITNELRAFVGHPDVLQSDRDEIVELVEQKVREEKARKKSEKASRKEKEQAEKEPVDLVNVIKNATGIDVAAALQKVAHAKAMNQVPMVPIHPGIGVLPPSMVPPTGIPSAAVPLPAVFTAPPPPVIRFGTTTVTSVRHGKAGFSTPHPNEVPPELRLTKPDLILPIPDELRIVPDKKQKPEVAAIPNALLPLNQRVPEPQVPVYVRPPMRKTLQLAGARPGKKSDKIDEERRKEEAKEKNRRQAERDRKDPIGALNRALPPGLPPIPQFNLDKRKRGGRPRQTLPNGLNKSSPLAVKRYHARQLAKETGITLDQAMIEIEDQIAEFGEDTEENRDADAYVLEEIKRRGDEMWNEKHNYVPADHSQGIPGVDRPPGGGAPPPMRDMDRDRDWDRGGKKARNRGGVKEREKRRKREEAMRGGGGRNRWADNGPPLKQGRWAREDQQGGYDDYYSGSNSYRQDGYDDRRRDYDQYYEGQGGYDNYDQQQYGEERYDQNGYDYDYYQQPQEGGEEHNYYHQEETGQYYNEYYGTEAPPTEYHATFDTPADAPAKSSAHPPRP
ncbi:unnamed protein product [Caenorhabditis sp. 36 PRJEB53466]|nr:unnamed protein product [Caenorhabditis sp. 36 PRJEB53466]